MKHTPTPWKFSPIGRIYDQENDLVATTEVVNKKDHAYVIYNAEFIIRAVNSHDELLEAAKELNECAWHSQSCTLYRCDCGLNESREKLEKAIQNAEKK